MFDEADTAFDDASEKEIDVLSEDWQPIAETYVNEDTNESNDGFSIETTNDESVEPIKPAKSKAALDTLLALAKTYIAMDDFETARQSLQEVMEFGDETQQKEAKILWEKLSNME